MYSRCIMCSSALHNILHANNQRCILITHANLFHTVFEWIYDNIQGKFEEDRYLQQQEEKWREHMRELRLKEEHLNEQRLHEQVVEPVKRDFANLLAKTGDTVSEEGLENLAKLRLNF